MDSIKYIGLDVHKETISIAVMNGAGKLLMESIIETKASTVLQFIQGLRGELHVTLEEGTWAAWLYDLLKRPGATSNPLLMAFSRDWSPLVITKARLQTTGGATALRTEPGWRNLNRRNRGAWRRLQR